MTETMTQQPLKLETETCSRCGGGGRFSYCQRWGSVCFKCGGKGTTYTKRGAAASKYLDSLLSRPARELKPGDKIRTTGATIGGGTYRQWETVKWVGWENEGRHTACQVMDDGSKRFYFAVRTDKGTNLVGSDEEMFRVGVSPEEKRAAMEKAFAYQNTLTKAGTPRKR